MKVYISLPMAGALSTVKKRYELACEDAKNKYKDVEIISPHNIDEFSDNGINPDAEQHTWAWHLGEDVKQLLECDAIYLCQGWSDSKGCRVELAVAKSQNMLILKNKNADSLLPLEMKDKHTT